MKKLLISALLALAALSSQPFAEGQPSGLAVLQGTWAGSLFVGKTALRIVFHVEVADGGAKATMDSPDQGATGISVASVGFADGKVIFDVKLIKGSFEGTLDPSGRKIAGFWKQGGAKLPLALEKQAALVVAKPARPQEPKPPFPYMNREVVVKGPKGIRLAGTLCLPEGAGPFPAALLVTGSGAQDRDETIMGHRPFLVIADCLARRSIATLRLDDRGVGASTGDFGAATTFDFAEDAKAALAFLREEAVIDSGKIGIIGHSEGGLIAALVASKDPGLAFAVLLAGPGLSGEKLLYLQNAAIARASGVGETAIAGANAKNASLYAIAMGNDKPAAKRSRIVEIYLGMLPQGAAPGIRAALEEEADRAADQLLSPWFITFLSLDPAPYLAKVKMPLLALVGSKDLQVPAEENLTAIGAAMRDAGNTRFTPLELKGLNHLFQTAGTGLPEEYGTIEETFSPKALAALGDWLSALLR
ncbi:MAG: alpha/beta fold hydrolase [Spirochaetes bacterium]|nr:alpha/beta fold hydrolase [Spirochaetota bacterium]